MVKGVSKRIVVVRPQGDIFEEAIFVVRAGAEARTSDDILHEASHLADLYTQRRGRRGLLSSLPPPVYTAIGATGVGIAWILTTFL